MAALFVKMIMAIPRDQLKDVVIEVMKLLPPDLVKDIMSWGLTVL